MENNSEETLLKSRSSRSCLRHGYRLFLSRFKEVFKASWIPAIAYGACFSTLATLAVIFYPRLNISVHVNPQSLWHVTDNYKMVFTLAFLAVMTGGFCELWFYATGIKGAFTDRAACEKKGIKRFFCHFDWKATWKMIKGTICTLLVFFGMCLVFGMLAEGTTEAINRMGGRQLMTLRITFVPAFMLALALSLPLIHVFIDYLNGQHGYWQSLPRNFKTGMRHWGMLFATTLLASITYGVTFSIMLLPAVVLALANFQANLGMLTDDPIGMPSYIVPLTIFVMLGAGFVNVFLRLSFLFIWEYVHGSIIRQEEERQQFIMRSQPDILSKN